MNHSPHLPGNPHARNLTSTEYTTEAPEHAAACQVEALLALAYEQRTANLIALHQFGLSLYMDGKATDSAVDYLEDMNRLDAQIVERIGLNGDTK